MEHLLLFLFRWNVGGVGHAATFRNRFWRQHGIRDKEDAYAVRCGLRVLIGHGCRNVDLWGSLDTKGCILSETRVLVVGFVQRGRHALLSLV